jgi:anthranilate phosphoribosyltransferase
LLSGELTDTEAASLLVQLAEKGETSEELHGFVTSLLEHAEPVPFDGATIDTCGTGGSGLERFNVSTLVAFVLAAAGLTVAKHGNRGSRRPNGSFDLLEALGVPIDLDGQAVARALEETGLAFLYARRFHPVMKGVAQARKLAARRTIFNLAGPLSNPTRVQVQVVGSCSERDARTVAGCLWRMGRHQAITVTGHSGIDEVDLAGPSLFFRASAEPVADSFDPELLGLSRIPYAELPGGDAGVNAELFRSLLAGTGSKPLAQLVCFSAAVVFRACGKAKELAEGLEQARELLGSGQVREKFEQYKALAQRLHKP